METILRGRECISGLCMSTKCVLWIGLKVNPLPKALYGSSDIFFLCLVFLMTCKPPLYMGPEYIKYFSDKTIDVSARPPFCFLGP